MAIRKHIKLIFSEKLKKQKLQMEHINFNSGMSETFGYIASF
jgi:hypothetical protein